MDNSFVPLPSSMSLTDPAFARTLLLPVESMDAFAAFRDAHFARYRPACAAEQHHVEEIVWCHWRIRRAWAAESGCAAAQQVSAKNSLPANASPMEVFCLAAAEFAKTRFPDHFRRQENSLNRQARHAERALADLQAHRRAEEKARQEHAAPKAPPRPVKPELPIEPGNEQPPSHQPVTPLFPVAPNKAA